MPDEIIFYERQPGAGMYIIKKGLIKLTKTVNEEKVKISELRDGEFFGEMSLLDDYPRSAEATAVEKTEALGIFRPDLFDLIETQSQTRLQNFIKTFEKTCKQAQGNHRNEIERNRIKWKKQISKKHWKTFEIIALGFVLLSLLLILYFVRGLLTPFIIAFVIVFFLNPIVDYMEGEGINRTLAVVTLIILSVFVLFIIWKLTWPTLQAEINNFKDNAPLYINRIQAGLNRAIDLLEKNIVFIPKGTLEKALQQKIKGLNFRNGRCRFSNKNR